MKGLKRYQQRSPEDRLEELGLTRTVLEPVPVSSREDDSIPHEHRRN
jgi:hypothetical protein